MGQDPRLKQTRAALTLAALGIVYGDTGTSPLYAAKETFNPVHGIPLNAENILGGLSAIFWSLMIVVSLKSPSRRRRSRTVRAVCVIVQAQKYLQRLTL